MSDNNFIIADRLLHTTTRIECFDENGQLSTGTGFFFDMKLADGNVPLLVTNKHVIRNSQNCRLILTTKNEDGSPKIGNKQPFYIPNFEKNFILHPDNDVDLAVLPMAPLLNRVKAFTQHLDESLLPTEENIKDIFAMDDIIMIGYPNSLIDPENNLPICRKGIAATPPQVDYVGKKQFLIDAAVYPRSSGSPVFLYNPDTYTDHRGNIYCGERLILMGILFAGFERAQQGEIRIREIPTRQEPVLFTSIPINLGIVIKSERLMDFKPIIEKIARQSHNGSPG